MIFCFDTDRKIHTLAGFADTGLVAQGQFDSVTDLLACADKEKWSRQDLERIYNGMAGTPPWEDVPKAKRLRNRPAAAEALWKLAQRLNGNSQPVAETSNEKEEEQMHKKAKARHRRAEKKATTTTGVREGTKSAIAIALMERKDGASIDELMKKLDWQRHSVRGFVSTLQSKHGAKINVDREGKNVRYRIG